MEFNRIKRKTLIRLSVLSALGIAAIILTWLTVYRKYYHNPYASCSNCRTFVMWEIKEYIADDDGWFPRGGRTPLDSLAKCISEKKDVCFFTSHGLRKKAVAYWESHKSLNEDVCCYRYNEGLREGDPGDLIVMYYHKPTRWDSHHSRESVVGRPVLQVDMWRWSWQFVPEAEFQKLQEKTEKYIKKRQTNWGEIEKIKERLAFIPQVINYSANVYEIQCFLENRGDQEISVKFTNYAYIEGNRSGSDLLEPLDTIIELKPGEKKKLSGCLKLGVSFKEANGFVKKFRITHEGRSGSRGSSSGHDTNKPLAEFINQLWIKATARIIVDAKDSKSLELILTSNKVWYLQEEPNIVGD